MAARVGVDRETYNKWENDDRPIAETYIPALASETGEEPGYFREERVTRAELVREFYLARSMLRKVAAELGIAADEGP